MTGSPPPRAGDGTRAGEPLPSRSLRLAHRGDHRAAPENSLDAFRAALAVPGCDGLEFDVRLSADGVPVVVHDATLERVQGRPGRVEALAEAELAAVGIPTLAAVLGAVPAAAFLDVELKVDGGPAVVEVLRAARGRTLVNAVVSSFEAGALETIARLEPDWPRWLNADNLGAPTLERARRLGCRGISAEWHAIDAASLARARQAGLEVAAWTVTGRATFDRLVATGIVAICVEGAALAR